MSTNLTATARRSMTARELAEHHEAAHARAASRNMQHLRSVRSLFGDGLGEVLERAAEDVTENGGEALHHYRTALAEVDQDLARERQAHEDDLVAKRAMVAIVCEAVAELRRRYRSVLPEQFDALALLADAAGLVPFPTSDEEPF